MRLCSAKGFYGLNVPKEMGGGGIGLLGYSLAAEQLAQGCPSTALSFNMHLSIIGPLFESPDVTQATQQYIADLVVKQQKLIAGNFSEPTNSGLLATYKPATRAKRVAGGYQITGRKAFASMLEAADFCAVLVHPEEAQSSSAALLILVPREASGRRVEQVWDTLGMRATRSDSLILDNCFVPEEAGLYQVDDILTVHPQWGELVMGFIIQPSTWESQRPPITRCARWSRSGSPRAIHSPWPIIQMSADAWLK